MSSSRSLTPHDASQYDLIEAAVRETERGRWFLEEYARRNRNADTDVLLGAIHRLESAVTGDRGGGDVVRFRGDLMDMADAIARTRAEVAALSGADHGESRLTVASEALDSIVRATERATSDILGAAEAVQEAAWTLRETGADGALCDDLDRHATQIYTACSFQDLTAQRTSRIVHTLRYLEDRIASMIGIWGSEAGVPDLDAEARIRRDTAQTLNAALDQTDVDRFLDMDSPAPPAAPVRPPLSAVALHEDLAFLPASPADESVTDGKGAEPAPAAEIAPVVSDIAAEAVAQALADDALAPDALETQDIFEVQDAMAEAPSAPAAEPDLAARAAEAPAEEACAQDAIDDATDADEAVAEDAIGDLFDVPTATRPPANEAVPPAAAEVDDLAAAFLDLDRLSIEEKIALFA